MRFLTDLLESLHLFHNALLFFGIIGLILLRFIYLFRRPPVNSPSLVLGEKHMLMLGLITLALLFFLMFLYGSLKPN